MNGPPPDPSPTSGAAGPPGGDAWDRLSRLFEEARDRQGEAREAFLEALDPLDQPSLPRLRRLLAAHDAAESGEDRLSGLQRGLEGGRAADLLRAASALPDSSTDAGDPFPGSRSPEASGPLPGDSVGRYRVIRRLGRGGMGAVHEAHDPVLDRLVALKFLPRHLDDGAQLLEEARAASALDHPGIGTLYEIGEDGEGRGFLAMAHYPGGTLRDRLREGPLPVDEALALAIQVAAALDAAHRRGILHRDVKPENLLFDGAGRVKLVDFGIARVLGGSAPGRAPSGTLPYMSPEEVEGRPSDGRADLWSLGVVLVEMLTGKPPFASGDRRALLDAIRGASGADLATPARALDAVGALDPRLRPVVERLLSRDPETRYPTGAAAARALEGVRRRPARPRWMAGTAAGLVLLLLGAGVLVGRQAPRLMEARGFGGEAFAPRGEILVPPFEAAEGLDELALATREALVVDLQQSGFVRVLPRPRVEEALALMGRPPEAPLQGALALEVAERAGAGAVL